MLQIIRQNTLLSQGVEFWAINTDSQALAHHSAPNKLQIGNQVGVCPLALAFARDSLSPGRSLGTPGAPNKHADDHRPFNNVVLLQLTRSELSLKPLNAAHHSLSPLMLSTNLIHNSTQQPTHSFGLLAAGHARSGLRR